MVEAINSEGRLGEIKRDFLLEGECGTGGGRGKIGVFFEQVLEYVLFTYICVFFSMLVNLAVIF